MAWNDPSMFWFRFKLYWRTAVATWQTFGLSNPLGVYVCRRPIAFGLMRAMLALDNVFFPGYRRIEVRKPIFIIGHPRSGTTFLHRLLAETREFCTFDAWQVFFPALVARRLLGGLIMRRVRQGKSSFFPKEVGHEAGLDQVEEEELLFLYNGNTQFVSCLSPLAFSDGDFADLVYADDQPEAIRRDTMAFLKGCFQRQIYATGKTQVVAKMNYSGMRLRSLLEAFPDARVIYVARSPLETIPSHLTLHRNMFAHMWGLERIPKDRLQRYYERRYRHNVAFYRYVEGLIDGGAPPCNRVMVLCYDELRRDLDGSIRKLVEFTGIELSPELQARIDSQARQQKSYRREHKNLALEEFGLTRDRVAQDLEFVFERYGFEK